MELPVTLRSVEEDRLTVEEGVRVREEFPCMVNVPWWAIAEVTVQTREEAVKFPIPIHDPAP